MLMGVGGIGRVGRPGSTTGRKAGGEASGPVADILLDFVNGVYRVDGATYATAALAGFTGAGTFNASGYTATGTQRLTKSGLSLPGDFVVVVATDRPAGNSQIAWQISGGFSMTVEKNSGGVIVTPDGMSAPTFARVAYGLSSGTCKLSVDGAAVTSGSSPGAIGTASMYVGNGVATTYPWTVPIKSLAIYKQTLTDAQISAL